MPVSTVSAGPINRPIRACVVSVPCNRLSYLLYMVGTSTPSVRLVGSNHTWEGRVEVLIEKKWGTICDDYWGIKDADVGVSPIGLQWGPVRLLLC